MRLKKYLNEKMDKNSAALEVIEDFGLPNTAKLEDFYSDIRYWAVIVKFKNKFYGKDASGDIYEEKSKKKIIEKIKQNTGINFS